MRWHFVGVWIAVLMIPVKPLPAQRLDSIAQGTRVRVVMDDGEVVTGAFGFLRGDSIDVTIFRPMKPGPAAPRESVRGARALAIGRIQNYAVFERNESRAGHGALVGAGFGLALIGVTLAGDIACERKGGAANIPATALAVPTALVLVVVGAVLGSHNGPERWSIPRTVHATMLTSPTGAGAALSVRF
jgi:hypothetical protein